MLKLLIDLKKKLTDCLITNKIFFILIVSTFFLGMIIAIIYLITFREVITFQNLIDYHLYAYIKQDINLFSFFIRIFFTFILLSVFLFLIFTNKITKYLFFLISLYFGYFIVFNMGVIIISFGFFGFIFAIIVTFLFGLMYFIFLSLIALNCNECSYSNYFYNCKNRFNIFLALLIMFLILSILEILLMPLFSSTFIIIYL